MDSKSLYNDDKSAQENASAGNRVQVSMDFEYRGVERWSDYWSIETGDSRDGWRRTTKNVEGLDRCLLHCRYQRSSSRKPFNSHASAVHKNRQGLNSFPRAHTDWAQLSTQRLGLVPVPSSDFHLYLPVSYSKQF